MHKAEAAISDPATDTLLRVAPYLVFLAVFAARALQRRSLLTQLDLRPPPLAPMAAWLLGFLAFAISVEFVLFSLNLLEVSAWQLNTPELIIRVVGIVVLAPIAEEILFRGILLNWLEARLGNTHVAILLLAGAFVAVHAFAYDGSLEGRIGIAQTFVDACLFAYARKHTKSLWTPILMHAAGNAIAVLERVTL